MSEKPKNQNELYTGKLPAECRAKLNAPFPAEAIGKYDSKSYLSSIKAIYIIERLNDVFGLGGWTFDHEIVADSDDYVSMKGFISIHEFGFSTPFQYGGHKKGGKGTEAADGYKSAVTDALTKCASFMEVGIQVFKGKQSHTNKHVEPEPKPLSPELIAEIEQLVDSHVFTEEDRKKINWSGWKEEEAKAMLTRMQSKAKEVRSAGVSAGQIEVQNFLFGQGLHDEAEQGVWMDKLIDCKTYAAGEKVVKLLDDETVYRYEEMNKKETA